jgi:hypothetical protein
VFQSSSPDEHTMVPTKSLSKHDNNCVLSSDWVLSILNPPQSEFVYTEPCASDEDKITSEYHLRIPGKSASDTVCSFTVLSSILARATGFFNLCFGICLGSNADSAAIHSSLESIIFQ